MEKRIAVVTGASRGIGRAAALALAEAGCHVVAIARTEGGLTELDDEIQAVGGSATLVPMSVTDGEAVDRLGGALFDRYGRVDVLVGNAGILGPMSPLQVIDPKKWDEVFAINVTANWRLIRSLDPLLRQSLAPRVLFVTSGSAYKCRAYWGPYSVSKAALEALARTYANEVVSFGVKVNLFSPGALRTRMRAQAMPGEDPMTLRTPEDAAPYIVDAVDPALERTGQIFDFASLSWLEPRAPEPI